MTEKGIIALSPWRHSQMTNRMIIAPAPQKRPMITELFHAYCRPPSSSARKNWIAAGAKSTNPKRSSLVLMISNTDRARGLTVEGISTIHSRTATTAPIGRLI